MAWNWRSYFELDEHDTTISRELLAAVTTFMTMAYIIAVNPGILAAAGMPEAGVMAATCLAAAIACFVMGIVARYPFALAPGMGLNAYFAYTVAAKYGGYEVALGMVFLSGVIFLLLTFVKIRQLIIDAIPLSLKHAVAAGIGLFIALIGFQHAGLVVDDPVTLVTSGELVVDGSLNAPMLVAVFGLALMVVLFALKVRGAILIGIVAATLVGLLPGVGVTDRPNGIVAMPEFSVLGKLDVMGAMNVGLIEVVFAFLFVDLFDSVGTLVGLADRAGYLRNGNLPRATHALFADATGTLTGSLLGTSTVTSYIESAAGIEEGGRTGLTAIFVGVFFLIAMFFSPLVIIIPKEATAPALIVVGAMMIRCIKDVPWADLTEAIPAFLVMVAMPFFYSIAQGIALGFIFYPLAKVAAGKWREVHWLVYVLGALFLLRFIFLGAIA